jgi:S1-C subfamily serine protease
VRDIYDYTRLLSDLKPGERVSAVVKRGEGEVALEITVAARPDAAR